MEFGLFQCRYLFTFAGGPKQIVMGDGNKIVKLVNLDASVLARLDLANAIRGSSGACNGIGNKLDNELNSEYKIKDHIHFLKRDANLFAYSWTGEHY